MNITDTPEYRALRTIANAYTTSAVRSKLSLLTEPENESVRHAVRTATGSFLGDLIVEDPSARQLGIDLATATALHRELMQDTPTAWDLLYALEAEHAYRPGDETLSVTDR